MDIRRFFQPTQRAQLNQIEHAGRNPGAEIREISIENEIQNTAHSLTDEIVSFHENGVVDNECFEIVPGKRLTSKLLFLKKEKCLYIQVSNDKSGKRYKCYMTSCPARAVIRVDGVCEKSKKNFLHVQHNTHCELRAKFFAENRIKKSCANVEELCSGSNQSVSVRDIFNKETMRYALLKLKLLCMCVFLSCFSFYYRMNTYIIWANFA